MLAEAECLHFLTVTRSGTENVLDGCAASATVFAASSAAGRM